MALSVPKTSVAVPVAPPAAGGSLLLLLLLGFVVLAGRLVAIHVGQGARLTAYADRQQIATAPLPAQRGFICDSRGRILAGSRLQKGVFADPKLIPDKRQAAALVAEIVGVGASEIETDLVAAGARRFFVLARGLTDAQVARIEQLKIPGIGLFDEPARVYSMGSVAGQVIGFCSPDGVGISGLEHQFDSWLAGRNGFKTVVCDVRRQAFWLSGQGYQPPRDGCSLVLTIDSVIQEHAESALEKVCKEFEAESAVAIVMRPGNGEILALAGYPGFNPQEYPDYPASLYRSRVLTDPVEPGSIFKPFIAAAALAEGVAGMQEVFDCHGGLLVDGARRLHDHHAYRLLSFQDIVVKSSNIGMALVGKRLGNRRLHQYIKAFGFGEPTGVGLAGEDPGILLPLHRWTSFSTTSLPMGHEIACTPIQVARAFCALANGGRLVRPRLVKAIVSADETSLRRFDDDEAAPRVIPESVAARVKDEMLVEVVKRGTGLNAALKDYQVFGKTGTAQVARHGGGGYEGKAYISSFVGGAPAYAPQVIVLVSVNRPNAAKGYYGGRVAAPVAGEIIGHALAYMTVPPDTQALADAR